MQFTGNRYELSNRRWWLIGDWFLWIVQGFCHRNCFRVKLNYELSHRRWFLPSDSDIFRVKLIEPQIVVLHRAACVWYYDRRRVNLNLKLSQSWPQTWRVWLWKFLTCSQVLFAMRSFFNFFLHRSCVEKRFCDSWFETISTGYTVPYCVAIIFLFSEVY